MLVFLNSLLWFEGKTVKIHLSLEKKSEAMKNKDTMNVMDIYICTVHIHIYMEFPAVAQCFCSKIKLKLRLIEFFQNVFVVMQHTVKFHFALLPSEFGVQVRSD